MRLKWRNINIYTLAFGAKADFMKINVLKGFCSQKILKNNLVAVDIVEVGCYNMALRIPESGFIRRGWS